MNFKEKYIFLCGHRKCGTTLLLNLFDGHPSCCVYPTDISVLYGYFPKYVIENYSEKERLARLDLVAFGSLERLRFRRNLGQILPVEKMRDHFFNNLDSSSLDKIDKIIRQIIASYRFVTNQTIEERPFTLIKETSLEIYAQELAEAFPDSKFIPLLRDPRDNYGALRAGVTKHYSKFDEDEKHILTSLIHRAGLSMRLMPSNMQILGKKRFRPLIFEQLVTETQSILSDVLEFLGLEWDECMMQPTVMRQTTIGNNYDNENFREITSKNVNRWRERITDFEAKVIEFHLGDAMQQWGYQLEYPLHESAQAASEFYKWSNTRYFFKDSFTTL